MKTIFIGSFPSAFPVYSYLTEQQGLQAVFIVKENYPDTLANTLSRQFQEKSVSEIIVSKKELNKALKLYLSENKVDVSIVFQCSVKISKEVFKLPKYGFINIHPGKFPENRGADPIFWTIKNQEKSTFISIHKIDENFDTGEVLLEDTIPVHFGETWGMLNSKIALQTVESLKKALDLIAIPENYNKQGDLQLYNNKPTKKDLSINWEEQTADEIESLVNACNPKYGGASTYYENSEAKIIEVSPVDNTSPMFGKTPGEIIHAHPQEGLFVCCKYGQLIRINIMKTDAGILTGNKYASIGIQTGQKFQTSLVTNKLTKTI